MSGNIVKDYYDAFLESRMLGYRLSGGNERLDRAIGRIATVVQSGESLLDLGCGIGIVPEAVSARLQGRLRCWACDLSPRNIWYAEKTVRAKSITFFVADLINDFDEIATAVGHVNVVTMIDVIEHIPQEHHADLFRNIQCITRPGARFVLTYPSPLYQEYLLKEKPEELQIIDEVVDLQRLTVLAAENGFALKHFSLEDVRMRNQYVHVVFEREPALTVMCADRTGLAGRVRARLEGALMRALVRPYRRWKYVHRVFNTQ